MSDHPTPAPRAPEGTNPLDPAPRECLVLFSPLNVPWEVRTTGEDDRDRYGREQGWEWVRMVPESRARAAEEELERVRGAAREVIAAFRWMDQCRGKGIAWRREKPAYEGLKAAVDRAGSQGEERG